MTTPTPTPTLTSTSTSTRTQSRGHSKSRGISRFPPPSSSTSGGGECRRDVSFSSSFSSSISAAPAAGTPLDLVMTTSQQVANEIAAKSLDHDDEDSSRNKNNKNPLAHPNEASAPASHPMGEAGRGRRPPHEGAAEERRASRSRRRGERTDATARSSSPSPPSIASEPSPDPTDATTTPRDNRTKVEKAVGPSSSRGGGSRGRGRGSGSGSGSGSGGGGGGGGGGRFLASLKPPSWLVGKPGGGSEEGEVAKATPNAGDRSRRRSRSLSLEPVSGLTSPSRSRGSRRRSRRPAGDPRATPPPPNSMDDNESPTGGGGDGFSDLHNGGSSPAKRRPSSKMSLGRFGRGRGRSKSPSAPPKEEAPPLLDEDPSALGNGHHRSRSRDAPAMAPQQPVDLDDDDVSGGEAEDGEGRPWEEASLADNIYARAREEANEEVDVGLGGTIGAKVNSAGVMDDNDPGQPQVPPHGWEGPAPPPAPTRIEPVRSLKDLRKRIEYAQSQQWVRGKGVGLAAIRETLGLEHLQVPAASRLAPALVPPAVEPSTAPSNDAQSASEKTLLDHALPLYRKFVQSLQSKGDASPYVQYVLNSSSCEPEPAIMIFQFLHYLDVLAAAAAASQRAAQDPQLATSRTGRPVALAWSPASAEIIQLADEVAKMPTLACWCREILRYPNEFPDALLECCLGHLQRFTRIQDPVERRQHVLCILFRGSKDRSALDELRRDLERVVNRTGRRAVAQHDADYDNESKGSVDDKAGFLTLARTVFLYNSVERAVGANRTATKKRSGLAKPSNDTMGPFRAALERHRGQVPESLVKALERELLAPCAGPRCFHRGSVRCCAAASYCSLSCRDLGWKVHKNACTFGTKIELCFSEAEVVPEDEAHPCSPMNGQHADENAAMPERQESPRRRDDEAKKALAAAMKTPQTPKVPLDVIEIFDELRVVPLAPQTSSTDWLLRQDAWLREHPDFDYFLARPMGKLGIQFASAKARAEFKDLRTNAPRNVDDVEEMLEILVKSCPELKPTLTRQLEKEYAMDLSKAAESPTRELPTSDLLPNCRRPKSSLITPSPPPKPRVEPSSLALDTSDGIDRRTRPRSIAAL